MINIARSGNCPRIMWNDCTYAKSTALQLCSRLPVGPALCARHVSQHVALHTHGSRTIAARRQRQYPLRGQSSYRALTLTGTAPKEASPTSARTSSCSWPRPRTRSPPSSRCPAAQRWSATSRACRVRVRVLDQLSSTRSIMKCKYLHNSESPS